MEGILLGIIQGLTEFLPISSSGHLVLFQNMLGFEEPALLFDCALHFGTLLSIIIFFWPDILHMLSESWGFSKSMANREEGFAQIHNHPHAAMTLWVITGTIPTALIGLFLRGPIESLFASTNLVGAGLIFTGLVTGISRFIPEGYGKKGKVGLISSLLVGSAQGLALVPGISRSGTTIVCGLLLKMDRELAARFSFLLAMPAILGALVLQLRMGESGNAGISLLLAGVLTSTLTGLMALKVLISIMRRGRLYYFAPYCWALGLTVLFLRAL